MLGINCVFAQDGTEKFRSKRYVGQSGILVYEVCTYKETKCDYISIVRNRFRHYRVSESWTAVSP